MTEDQRRMRAAVETIENQKVQIEQYDKMISELCERVSMLQKCLNSGISLSRELSTLLSCNDHEVARWKDSAYEAIEGFDRRLHEYGIYMSKVEGDS